MSASKKSGAPTRRMLCSRSAPEPVPSGKSHRIDDHEADHGQAVEHALDDDRRQRGSSC